MFKNALISVSDKSGLVEFLKPLAKKGLRIVSTGGTAAYLRENGFELVDVSEQTGFPEVMGGRVKTLHPNVHMALLARLGNSGDDEILKKYKLEPFDLVIVNLYPFEKSLLEGKSDPEMIEKIDIGGPTLLRASAKNHSRITTVVDPVDYEWILKNEMTVENRRKLAGKVFSHVSRYDAMIGQYLSCGERLGFSGSKVQDLRYGENPQQKAGWFASANLDGWQQAQVLQGKELSYNNLLDLEAARNLVIQFSQPAVVAVKHNNPCGVAEHQELSEATRLAIAADPMSVFGGIVAINRKLDEASAQKLSLIFLECIVAPDFEPEALEIFAKKKNLRILKWPQMLQASFASEIRSIAGGFLMQDKDSGQSPVETWKFLSEKPSQVIRNDLIFAEKVCASLKSNSIAIVALGQTLGLGMGQVNRVEAVQHAIDRMKTHHGEIKDAVLASDAFFPFADSIEKIAAAGIRWVIQPGGSTRDEEVIAAAARLGVNMVMTGTRHFRH